MSFKSTILPILLSTIWVSISEFVRNEFILKDYWTEHYEGLGLTFATEPINGAVWGIWAMTFSVVLFILLKRFSFTETFFLGWVIGFVLMWLVVGNMQVLPFGILTFAIPASWLEVFLALFIMQKLTPKETTPKA